jgi:hypothetical protein
MIFKFKFIFLSFAILCETSPVDILSAKTIFEEFKVSREITMRKERKMFLGSNITLNQDEQFALVLFFYCHPKIFDSFGLVFPKLYTTLENILPYF